MSEYPQRNAERALARLVALQDQGEISFHHAFVRAGAPPPEFELMVLGAPIAQYRKIVAICGNQFGLYCRCLPVVEDLCITDSEGTPLQDTDIVAQRLRMLFERLETEEEVSTADGLEDAEQLRLYDDTDEIDESSQSAWQEGDPDAWRKGEAQDENDTGQEPEISFEVALSFPGFCVVVIWFGLHLAPDLEISFTRPVIPEDRFCLSVKLARELNLALHFRITDFDRPYRVYPDGYAERV